MIPATIQDAMTVTVTLGHRYLWVDRYCVDQSDPEEKQQQIQQRGQIYGASAVTIIAAAGADPSHGLPGVGSRSRMQTPISRVIRGRIMVGMHHDARVLVASSVWNTRAWTYQEAMLSNDA